MLQGSCHAIPDWSLGSLQRAISCRVPSGDFAISVRAVVVGARLILSVHLGSSSLRLRSSSLHLGSSSCSFDPHPCTFDPGLYGFDTHLYKFDTRRCGFDGHRSGPPSLDPQANGNRQASGRAVPVSERVWKAADPFRRERIIGPRSNCLHSLTYG